MRRGLVAAREVGLTLGLLSIAFVLLPFWWAWLGWQWSKQRAEAVRDANLTDYQRGRGGHYDTGPATTETEAA